jgi:hypothetical protein
MSAATARMMSAYSTGIRSRASLSPRPAMNQLLKRAPGRPRAGSIGNRVALKYGTLNLTLRTRWLLCYQHVSFDHEPA